jgi:hypothetical protein
MRLGYKQRKKRLFGITWTRVVPDEISSKCPNLEWEETDWLLNGVNYSSNRPVNDCGTFLKVGSYTPIRHVKYFYIQKVVNPKFKTDLDKLRAYISGEGIPKVNLRIPS